MGNNSPFEPIDELGVIGHADPVELSTVVDSSGW